LKACHVKFAETKRDILAITLVQSALLSQDKNQTQKKTAKVKENFTKEIFLKMTQ